MAVARAVRAALALVIAMAAGDAAAQSLARPVAIYPFARSEGAAAEDAAARGINRLAVAAVIKRMRRVRRIRRVIFGSRRYARFEKWVQASRREEFYLIDRKPSMRDAVTWMYS